jgi:hypothetical protein
MLRKRYRNQASAALRLPSDRYFLIVAVTAVSMFLLYPYEPGYLVPALPGILILIDRSVAFRTRVALTCALVLNGLVGFPGYAGNATAPTRLALAQPGQLISLYQQRLAWTNLLEALEREAQAGQHAYVLDDALPVLWFHHRMEIAGGQWKPVSSSLTNFNGPLYDVLADRYFVSRWDTLAIRELSSRGYAKSHIKVRRLESR